MRRVQPMSLWRPGLSKGLRWWANSAAPSVSGGTWKPATVQRPSASARKASARLRSSLLVKHEAEPDFWSNAGLVEFDLYDAVASGTLALAGIRARIQPGTQFAPSSMAPHFSLGNRSNTPSKISVASVCMAALGIGM